jgi:hypothetical protein
VIKAEALDLGCREERKGSWACLLSLLDYRLFLNNRLSLRGLFISLLFCPLLLPTTPEMGKVGGKKLD